MPRLHAKGSGITSVEIPVLETERLRLRGHRLEDFPACVAMWGDSLVTRYISGNPLTSEEVWARVLRYTGHWALLGFGYWVVEEKESGAFAGEVGFADNKRDLGPDSLLRNLPEIGWVFSPRVHGRGLATEAVRAATRWGDTHFAGGPTGCIIGPENAASLRVAAKCGYTERQRLSYKDHTTIALIR